MTSGNLPPPPPPPPPGGSYADPFSSSSIDDVHAMDSGRPTVASAPGKVFLVLGGMVVFVVFMLIKLLPDDDVEDVPQQQAVDIVKEPAQEEIPVLDPTLTAPPPPVFEPPMLPQVSTQVITPEENSPTNELLKERMRSAMIISGSGSSILPDIGGAAEEQSEDENLQFANRIYKSNTEAATVNATHVGNLRRTIVQGKMIQAVLETVINTDLPGNIRAIVSRDIYAEAGSAILVPKGSRLIGEYNSTIAGGQKRVYVAWTRVVRPDGIDVMINSPLVDQIGQAGVAGQVDTKFTEIFSRAFLTSAITIAGAIAVDEINGEEGQTTTNTDGNTTSSNSASTEATVEAASTIADVSKSYLQRFVNIQPTILVDQGTPVNVFVNRDLIFPANIAGTQFID